MAPGSCDFGRDGFKCGLIGKQVPCSCGAPPLTSARRADLAWFRSARARSAWRRRVVAIYNKGRCGNDRFGLRLGDGFRGGVEAE